MFLEALISMALNLAVIFTVSYFVTMRATPLRLSRRSERLVTGVVFLSLCLLTLSMPFYSAPGVRLDMRPPLMGLAGWVGGPWVALSVAVGVSIARYQMGGAGVWAGIFACFVNAGAGLLFFGRPRSWRNMGLFILAIFAGVMAANLFISGEPLYHGPFPLVLLVEYSAATVIFHYLAHEIETRVTLAQRLYDELRFKETVLEVVDAGVAAFDQDGGLTLLNSAARQLLALEGDPIGRRADDLLTGSPALAQRVAQRERFSHELFTLRRADQELYLAVTGLPTDKGMIIALSNVSDVIATERETARRHRLSMLGELAAMAAHEIKNPLTAIKGFAQLLASRPNLDDGARRYAGVIVGEVAAIDRVVTDFLSIARTRAERLEQVALLPLLAEVGEETALRYPRAEVQVRTQLEQPALLTDRQVLKQILLNLYANAYDAMDERGTLQVRAAAVEGDVIIEVRDSGPGIPSDMLSKLFRPFTTTKAEGSGLGLAICERLAGTLRGEITAASPSGGGAVFCLRLPQARLAARVRQGTPA